MDISEDTTKKEEIKNLKNIEKKLSKYLGDVVEKEENHSPSYIFDLKFPLWVAGNHH